MRYDYKCNDCGHRFEFSHGMSENPVVVCEKCKSKKTERAISTPQVFVRGYGYMDKEGCHRDMNLHKLVNDDPYAHMRQPGEAFDMAQNLRKGGKINKGKFAKKAEGQQKMRYDYKCSNCGHIFEVKHGMTETPVVKCEKCKSKKTEKTFVTRMKK